MGLNLAHLAEKISWFLLGVKVVINHGLDDWEMQNRLMHT